MTSPTDNRTVMDVALPEGFEIHRVSYENRVEFEIHEGVRWPSSNPRPTTIIYVWPGRESNASTPGRSISWGYPYDYNSVPLARTFSVALSLAADEADRLDEEGRGA